MKPSDKKRILETQISRWRHQSAQDIPAAVRKSSFMDKTNFQATLKKLRAGNYAIENKGVIRKVYSNEGLIFQAALMGKNVWHVFYSALYLHPNPFPGDRIPKIVLKDFRPDLQITFLATLKVCDPQSVHYPFISASVKKITDDLAPMTAVEGYKLYFINDCAFVVKDDYVIAPKYDYDLLLSGTY